MRDFKSKINFFQGEYTLTLKITGGASVVVWSSALFQVERKRAAQSLREHFSIDRVPYFS